MKKKLIIGIISVLLILTGVGYGVGSFFVHYALSPVSDSAKRNINEEDKIDTAKGTEKVILQNQKKEQKKATEFKKTTSNANITNNDNLKLQANYKVQEKKTHNSKIILKLLLEKKKILYSNFVMDSGKIANSNTRKGNDIE